MLSKKEVNIVKIDDLQAHNDSHCEACELGGLAIFIIIYTWNRVTLNEIPTIPSACQGEGSPAQICLLLGSQPKRFVNPCPTVDNSNFQCVYWEDVLVINNPAYYYSRYKVTPVRL